MRGTWRREPSILPFLLLLFQASPSLLSRDAAGAPENAPSSTAGVSADPVWTAEGNQANANFGYSVATCGDVNGDGYSDVIVGARSYDAGESNEGRALVYHGGPAGTAPSAAWAGESNQQLAFYGSSVATAGDVNGDGYHDAIVGAPSWDGGESNEGAAFLYLGSATGLDSLPAWTAEGNENGAAFGFSVATAGDVNGDGYDDVLIGIRGHDGAASDAGRAVLHSGSASGLQPTASWTAEIAQENAAFGGAVASCGDVNGDGYDDVIVGAFFYDGAFTDEGAAYVYLGSAQGLASSPVWSATGGQEGASFGWSAAGAGDVDGDGYSDVLIGARYHDSGAAGAGRVYAFRGTADGVEATPAWNVDGTQTNGNFGWSVASAGDVNGDGYADAIVGAYRFDDVWSDAGKIWLYLGGRDGLSVNADWSASGGQETAYFGASVSTAGDVDGDGFSDIIAGAYFYDAGQTNEGRASIFRGAAELPSDSAAWRAAGGPQGSAYGARVAWAGDVNGDGRSDLLVSDPLFSGGAIGEGRADVFLGSDSGLDTSPEWTVTGEQTSAGTGRAISGAGDVNGDGFEDVLVGTPFWDGTLANQGKVELFSGSALGLSPSAQWSALGGEVSSFFGIALAGGADFDGDGFADFAIGASLEDGLALDSGVVFIYHGSGVGPVPRGAFEGGTIGGDFGLGLAHAGDVDADGFSDLLVAEPRTASVFLYQGSSSGLLPTPGWSATSGQPESRFGEFLAPIGDANGDGFSDFLVGAPRWSGGEVDEGAVFVYYGSAQGPGVDWGWSFEADQAGVLLDAAGPAGDLDHDGMDDLAIGISGFTGVYPLEGKALVFLGSASGFEGSAAWELSGGRQLARLGSSVAGRGDAQGDGFSDLVLGARGFADSASVGGAVFLYEGNRGAAVRSIRQTRVGASGPIALLGASDSENSFRIEAFVRSAAGRDAVAPVWEAKKLGDAFENEDALEGNSLDTGAPLPCVGSRSPFAVTLDGLPASRFYRWRVRFRSASPFFPGTPWFSLAGNGLSETDLRTAAPPSGVALDSRAFPELASRPSPFHDAATIEFTLARESLVTLTVHDLCGRRVASLLHTNLAAGQHVATWDAASENGREVAAGVYFVRLEAEGRIRAQKIVHLK